MQNAFLIGEKIYLRPLQAEDSALIVSGENNPLVRETLFLFLPNYPLLTAERIEQQVHSKESVVLTIVEKTTDQAVGQTALFRIDWVSRAAIFYLTLLEPACWGKGYGTESTQLMVDYAFETLNLNRIQLHVCAENMAAIKIYQKVGFIQEGLLRQAMFHHDRYCDFWVMGILKCDWLKGKKRDI
jgi:RimJ/RimL family protein N-acetyltransferase